MKCPRCAARYQMCGMKWKFVRNCFAAHLSFIDNESRLFHGEKNGSFRSSEGMCGRVLVSRISGFRHITLLAVKASGLSRTGVETIWAPRTDLGAMQTEPASKL